MARKTWIGTDGDLNVAGNYSPSGVPVAGDDLFFDGARSNGNVSTNLGTLNTAALTTPLSSITFKKNYTGLVGDVNTPMDVAANLYVFGEPSGGFTEAGSKRIMLEIDAGPSNPLVYVLGTATTSQDAGLPPLRINGGGGVADLYVVDGSVGLALDDETNISSWDQATVAGGQLKIGENAVLDSLEAKDGVVTNFGESLLNLILSGSAVYTCYGSATHTLVDVRVGATCIHNTDGTISTLKVQGTFDASGDPRPKTIGSTKVEIYSGGTILANTGDPSSITWTNGIDLVKCGIDDVTLDLGEHINLARTVLSA